jgi:hypothetical protein
MIIEELNQCLGGPLSAGSKKKGMGGEKGPNF